MRKVIALSKQSKKAQKSLPHSAARQLEWAKPHHPHCPQRQGVLQGKGKGRGPQGRLPSFFLHTHFTLWLLPQPSQNSSWPVGIGLEHKAN